MSQGFMQGKKCKQGWCENKTNGIFMRLILTNQKKILKTTFATKLYLTSEHLR